MAILLTPEQRARRDELRAKRQQVGSITKLSPEERQELMQLEQIKSEPGFLDQLAGIAQSQKEFSDKRAAEVLGGAPTPQSIASMQSIAKDAARPIPTVEEALAKKTQPEVGVVTSDDRDKTNKTGTDITLPKAYQDLMNSYSALGVQQKKDLEASMKNINSTIQELNDGFEANMAEAKTKAEKEKTRAEWASIASMLAKNIVGFAAAQQGVSPNAMAYETMDWGKRIADINTNLKNDIDTLRDTMKEKVMAKRLEGAGAKDLADMDYRSKLAALEGRKDLLLAQERAQADKDKLALDTAKAKEVVTTKPEDIRASLTNLSKAGNINEALKIAAAAGVPAAELDKARVGGMWESSDDRIQAIGILSDAIRKTAESRGGVSTTSKTTTGGATGQEGQPVVQSTPTADPKVQGLKAGQKFKWKDGKLYQKNADGTVSEIQG